MANYIGVDCITGNEFIVDDGGNTIGTLPQVWYIGGERDSDRFCITLTKAGGIKPSYTAITSHIDCEDCLSTNRLNIELSDCLVVKKIILPFSVFSGFTTIPSADDVFFVTIDDNGRISNDCYYVIQSTLNTITQYTTVALSEQTNCQTCYIESLTSYLVQQCNTSNTFYVLLPLTFVGGEFISFNEIGTLNQLCGEVIRQEVDTPTGIYLSTFRDCDDCLGQTSIKRELISCIDNTTEVVWGSVLYNLNQSSYLTIVDPNEGFSGCYRIGDETTSAVTVTGYLSYSPSPSCEDCIACNGFEFEYFVCGEPLLTGSTFSNQYIQVGQSFYNPASGCCQVSQIITANTSTDTFLSFYEYTNCEECTGSTTNYESWIATDCRNNSLIIITTPSGFSIGDYLTINRGTLTTSCAQIISVYAGEIGIPFAKTTEVKYSDCTNCNNNTYVAYPFAKCGESVATYYNLTLTNYNTILDNIDLGKYVFTNSSFDCYYLLNGCATPQFSFFTPNNYFTSCEQCGQPLSAGTPTVTCIICCPCSSSTTVTSVYSPFPTWTNQYNKPVLMLDAVLLGGNGLNA